MPLFSDGFESNDFSAWTGGTYNAGTSTLATSSTTAHCGTYSAKMDLTSFVDQVFCYYDLGSNQTDCYERIRWKCTAWSSPAGSNRYHCIMAYTSSTAGGGTGMFYLFAKKDLYGAYTFFTMYRDGTTLTSSSDFGSWTTNTWYCLEMYKDYAAVGTYEVWIDGSSAWSVSADTNNYYVRSIFIGNKGGGQSSGCTSTTYTDCVVADNAAIGCTDGEAEAEQIKDSMVPRVVPKMLVDGTFFGALKSRFPRLMPRRLP